MDSIVSKDPKIWEYLDEIGEEHWASLFSPIPKRGKVTNNASESLNNRILQIRNKSPLLIFIELSKYLDSLICMRREEISKNQEKNLFDIGKKSQLVKFVINKLEINIEKSKKWSVNMSSNGVDYQVIIGGDVGFNRIVDLEKMKCSCGFYGEMGYPCAHLCAVLMSKNLDVYNCVNDYYLLEKTRKCMKDL